MNKVFQAESYEGLIDCFARADIALKDGTGLGRIVVELLDEAKKKEISFDFADIAREIQEFQRAHIQKVIENGESFPSRQEVEDIHTYFCVAPLIEEQLKNRIGQEFERIKEQLLHQREVA